ncbi:MAG: hypothetical protein COV35_08580 [Alphaproteobacteria bacterium CG11_big_fil_rev_8_21_14_0_20_39_49]|nr:MAG: hypothetical protein COV35_08580 [Alphaproteobacteria bacterium CG11_big_fil_rev_8_21_14_0_20_39_49]
MPITIHDGTTVADGTPVGMNTGQYPRLDTDGNPLGGHGIYPLTGDEMISLIIIKGRLPLPLPLPPPHCQMLKAARLLSWK